MWWSEDCQQNSRRTVKRLWTICIISLNINLLISETTGTLHSRYLGMWFPMLEHSPKSWDPEVIILSFLTSIQRVDPRECLCSWSECAHEKFQMRDWKYSQPRSILPSLFCHHLLDTARWQPMLDTPLNSSQKFPEFLGRIIQGWLCIYWTNEWKM